MTTETETSRTKPTKRTYPSVSLKQAAAEAIEFHDLQSKSAFYNQKEQILRRICGKKNPRKNLTLAEGRIIQALKLWFSLALDPATKEPIAGRYKYQGENVNSFGVRTLTRQSILDKMYLTLGPTNDLLRRLKASGIVEEHNVTWRNEDGTLETKLRLRLDVNVLKSFVYAKGKEEETPKVRARKAKKNSKIVAQPRHKIETPFTNIYSDVISTQPGEGGSSVQADCANSENVDQQESVQHSSTLLTPDLNITAEPGLEPCVGEGKLDSAKLESAKLDSAKLDSAKLDSAKLDSVAREPGDELYEFKVSTPVYNVIQVLLKHFPAPSFTEEILGDLHFWVHKCQNLGLRLNTDKAGVFVRHCKNTDMVPLMDYREVAVNGGDGGEGRGNQYLDCTLPFLAKNWGRVWKWLRAQIHGRELHDAHWTLEMLDTPVQTLERLYTHILTCYQCICRDDIHIEFGDFLDSSQLDTAAAGNRLPAVDRLYSMFRAGLEIPALVAKYADELVDNLAGNPHFVQVLRDQGAPVDSWLKQSKKPRPEFWKIMQTALARTYQLQALGARYGSYQLPACRGSAQDLECPDYFAWLQPIMRQVRTWN